MVSDHCSHDNSSSSRLALFSTSVRAVSSRCSCCLAHVSTCREKVWINIRHFLFLSLIKIYSWLHKVQDVRSTQNLNPKVKMIKDKIINTI